MEKSPEINEIAAAILHVQQNVPSLLKDKTGQVGHRKYRYVDLPAVWEACKGLCGEVKLVPMFLPTAVIVGNTTVPCIDCLLIHQPSGQWISGTMKLCVESEGPQAQGSGLTYSHRYMLRAIFNIMADEDDDGAAAMPLSIPNKQNETVGTSTKPPAKPEPKSPSMTPAQVIERLSGCLTEKEFDEVKKELDPVFRSFDTDTKKYLRREADAIRENLDLPF